MKLNRTPSRTIIKSNLTPAVYNSFQPTGFPDIKASRFVIPGSNQENLLVESPQSIANRLEATVWDAAKQGLHSIFIGLPYVRLVNKATGAYIASSLSLPHRLASAYISKNKDPFSKRLIDDLNSIGVAAATFKYCPNSLLHGCFYSHVEEGKHKALRLVGGRIDAFDIAPVVTGGAVKDPISASGKDFDLTAIIDSKVEGGDDRASKAGAGNIIHYAEEFVAKRIEAAFFIDDELIAALPLEECVKSLLKAIACWKIYTFLQSDLRLRSNCILDVVDDPEVIGIVPPLEELEQEIPDLISQCAAQELFAKPAVTEIALDLKLKPKPPTTTTTKPKRDKKNQSEAEIEQGQLEVEA
ncbi:type I-U CRISPR-associated protein Cas7 [Leptolyngbya sp. FACHB-671]|uniref:type I-G CRISPR-associated RAMP protein Csb1/Cas7g n=1 Tax=Leptolyngbya sp. FACHB-671 TaxID=2692812 RepID=UPI0016857228|nr:type I-U CRISPR-associated RAMP protein Csb1/Cas7u [Leptolyngbya sp. FACHB-671]MBD2072113.1 type I-U CRISPR-associated protein Cas7 [Leptolyngbya sp. FACHB-671]